MSERAQVRRIGIPIILVGIWGGLIPFVGPLFGFSMGAGGAWTWTATRAELHVAPGIAAIVGGFAVLFAVQRSRRVAGGVLALAAGLWFLAGPTVASATTSGRMMGHMMMKSTGSAMAMSPLEAFGYHYGPGAIIAVLAAVAVGMSLYVAKQSAVPATATPRVNH